MATLCVAARFCGPPGAANGGYLAGRLASYGDETVRVRLHAPIPLDTELQVQSCEDGRIELRHQQALVAHAEPDKLHLVVPRAPEYLEALADSRRFIAFEAHVFPGCFVCGTARARGDGLRIFAGVNPEKTLVAAPWVPDASLAHADGKIGAEFMCAALDCPGYFAARDDGVPMLLGEYTAHIDRRVHVDEPCVVIGWLISVSGRKYQVGTALFDEDGEICGRARALWLAPRVDATASAR